MKPPAGFFGWDKALFASISLQQRGSYAGPMADDRNETVEQFEALFASFSLEEKQIYFSQATQLVCRNHGE